MSSGLMGQRGARSYVSQVFAAMVDQQEVSNPNLILDIISMALSRASDPKTRRGAKQDANFQRFRKHSQDMLSGLRSNGQLIVPEEATPEMLAAGVRETAEIRTTTNSQIGADPQYIAQLYENMVGARPGERSVIPFTDNSALADIRSRRAFPECRRSADGLFVPTTSGGQRRRGAWPCAGHRLRRTAGR